MPDIACTLKSLPDALAIPAAETAVQINPYNRVSPARAMRATDSDILPAGRLALLPSKYWGVGGVKLTVGFLDNAPADLQKRILDHMNAWGAYCNAKFVLTTTDPQVRITRIVDGYWSYLGTDILHIPKNQATMNLQGFTMQTPESEYHRVVRHETGHTLGYPHEHMRQELINRLDREKTVSYFQQTQGWSAAVTIQQVLTPISESSIRGTPHADQESIMCYQLPGSITIDGLPIKGGTDIDLLDQQFAASIYPLEIQPPAPPPVKPPEPKPPTGGTSVIAKILALIAAIRAGDIATVLQILSELFAAKQAGTLSDAEFAACEQAMKQAQTAKK